LIFCNFFNKFFGVHSVSFQTTKLTAKLKNSFGIFHLFFIPVNHKNITLKHKKLEKPDLLFYLLLAEEKTNGGFKRGLII